MNPSNSSLEKTFSLINKKWMVCTSMSFLGSFILILYLKYGDEPAGITSVQGILSTPSTNRSSGVNSIENSLDSNVEFSQRLEGVAPISQMPDKVDHDDEMSSVSAISQGPAGILDDDEMGRESAISQGPAGIDDDDEMSSRSAISQGPAGIEDDDEMSSGSPISPGPAGIEDDDERSGGAPISQTVGRVDNDNETSIEASIDAFISQALDAADDDDDDDEDDEASSAEPFSQTLDRVDDNNETGSGVPISQNVTSSAAAPISQALNTPDRVDNDNQTSSGTPISQNETTSGAPIPQTLERIDDDDKTSSGAHDGCTIFEGRWVYDPKAYPIYHARQCPFLSDQVNCKRNGRPDYNYASWKWEPRGCSFPRLDGKQLLERWRGKRVVIVGDSLNRNQWESLACILYSALPRGGAYVDARSSAHKLFRAKDYGCTVEFFWSPFLVPMEKKVIKLNALPPSAKKWRGADIMIFNTGHWWFHRGKLKSWDFFEHRGKLIESMEVEKAYKIALKTWANWVDRKVDPAKTTVFFRSFSPIHKRCYNETQPSSDASYRVSLPRGLTEILEKTLRNVKIPVKYLNVTHLSRFRKEAHTSVYTSRRGKLLTKEQQRQPATYADCSHWCLPGLPDTWNALMYMSTVFATSPQAS